MPTGTKPARTLDARGAGQDLIKRWLANVECAPERGQRVAYIFVMGNAIEILRSFGFEMVFPEINSLQTGVRKAAPDFLAKAEDFGYSPDVCSYVNRSASSPVQYDARKPKEDALLTMLREARAEAAIISAAKFCEPGLDDQLAQSHRLDAEKIPYLVLEFEEKMTSFEQMSMQVETFAESLLFE